MIDYDNQVKIIDFGLSRAYSKSIYLLMQIKGSTRHAGLPVMPRPKWSKGRVPMILKQ